MAVYSRNRGLLYTEKNNVNHISKIRKNHTNRINRENAYDKNQTSIPILNNNF